MTPVAARRLHLVTATVTTVALILQLILVVRGGRVLEDATPPGLALRLGRLVSYFTIQSNLLVAVTAWQLVRDPARDGRAWRVVRISALVGIVVTGVVHYVILRPLLDLHGADAVADHLLHIAVPLLTVATWLLAGPRPRVGGLGGAAWALAWPLAWTAWTLTVGALTGWVPYPFLDVDQHGAARVAGACLAVTALFVVVAGVVWLLDRRMDPVPRARTTSLRKL